MLHMGGKVQQMSLIAFLRMHRCDCKLAVGQGACLVEDHRADLGQDIHIIGPFDKDTLTRGAANAAKERERHADDQSAGTRDHQKHQGTIKPSGKGASEVAREQWW